MLWKELWSSKTNVIMIIITILDESFVAFEDNRIIISTTERNMDVLAIKFDWFVVDF